MTSKLRSPEVIKRKFFPKFPNYMTWLHIISIISVPVRATSKFKKAIESSWSVLSLKWHQISPKINRLGVRDHERSKTAFFKRNSFSMITSVLEMIEQWLWHHRVCLVTTHRNMYSITLKGQGQNLTSGQGHVVTQLGHIAYESKRLDEKHNENTHTSLSLRNQKLFVKTGWWT